MFVHTENIKRVVAVTTETGEDGNFVMCLEVQTTGNVRKVLRVPHYAADFLRAALESEFDMMPEDERKRSFQSSMTSVRKGK
jgi:hypothetical protein